MQIGFIIDGEKGKMYRMCTCFFTGKPMADGELMLGYIYGVLRDWSLITGRGGLQNGRGGPYENGGGRKKFRPC